MVVSYQRKDEELRGGEEMLDYQGRPLKALLLEAERKEQQWADLEAEVREAVKDTSRVDLKKKTFFVAHFNYLCEARGGFPPCEVGIVKFSLEEGIEEAWQEVSLVHLRSVVKFAHTITCSSSLPWTLCPWDTSLSA